MGSACCFFSLIVKSSRRQGGKNLLSVGARNRGKKSKIREFPRSIPTSFLTIFNVLLLGSLATAAVSGRSVQVSQGRRSGWAAANAERCSCLSGSGRWGSSDDAVARWLPDAVSSGVKPERVAPGVRRLRGPFEARFRKRSRARTVFANSRALSVTWNAWQLLPGCCRFSGVIDLISANLVSEQGFRVRGPLTSP